MKRCLVISVGPMTGETIAHQLQNILKGDVEVGFSQAKNHAAYTQQQKSTYDVFLFTSDVAYIMCAANERINVPFVIGERVINHKNIGALISLSSGTEVLLLNDSENSANEAIEQLIDIELYHIFYYPCFPGSKNTLNYLLS